MSDSPENKPVRARKSAAAKGAAKPAVAPPKSVPAKAKSPAPVAKPAAAKTPVAKVAPKPVSPPAPKPVVAAPAPKTSAPAPEAPKPAVEAAPVALTPPPTPAAAEKTQAVETKKVTETVVKPTEVAPAVAEGPLTVEVKSKPAPAPVAATQKGTHLMNDTVKKVEETTQKLFGDLKDRAAAAYEKSSKLAEDSVEFHKANFEALVESGKLAAKGAEAIGQDAAEFGRKSLESATSTLKTFASAKSPTELFKLQSDYAKSSFDTFIAEASKASEAWIKLGNEAFQPISNRISVAVEKVKSASL